MRVHHGARPSASIRPVPSLDVAEDRRGARVQTPSADGDEGVRRNDHLVARADPAASSASVERGGARAHSDTLARAAEVGKLALESLDLCSENERAAVKDALEGGSELIPKCGVLACERDERDVLMLRCVLRGADPLGPRDRGRPSGAVGTRCAPAGHP